MIKKILKITSLLIISLCLVGCAIFNNLSQRTRVDFDTNISEDLDATREPMAYEQYKCVNSRNTPEIGEVIKIIDGDSIEVMIEGKKYEVRYIGINTPEFHSADQEAAILATRENERLLINGTVIMFKDISETDKFGRLLRYVFTEDVFVNLELVKSGFAEVKAYPPDTACHLFLLQFDN